MRRLRSTGKIRRPTAEELTELAAREYLHLTPQEAQDIQELSEGLLSTLDRLDDLPQPRWPIKYTTAIPATGPRKKKTRIIFLFANVVSLVRRAANSWAKKSVSKIISPWQAFHSQTALASPRAMCRTTMRPWSNDS